MMQRLMALGVVAVGLAVPGEVWAQANSSAAGFRRELVEQAVRARDAGNHALALENAQRAGAIEMTPSLRMLIAQEQAAVGQLAPAINNAELCEREANNSPTMRDRAGIIAACHDLSVSLRARVGHIIVRVAAPVPAELRVTVAGEPMPAVAYGLPFLVTPGTVHVEASAPGYVSFTRDLTVNSSDTPELAIALTRAPRVTRSVHPAPIVVMAVGGASLVVSLSTLLVRNAAIARVEAQCNGPETLNCDPSARPDFDSAVTMNATSITTFAVGAAALLGGTIGLIVTSVQPSSSGTRAAAGPLFSPGVAAIRDGALLTLHGAF